MKQYGQTEEYAGADVLRQVGRAVTSLLRLLAALCRQLLPPTRKQAEQVLKSRERIQMECRAPVPADCLFLWDNRPKRTEKDGNPVCLSSPEKLYKHLRMVWVVRSIAFCAGAGMLCVLAALFLSLFRVKTVAVVGNSHYSAEELTALCGIYEGDELYAISPDAAAETLQKQCPYLASALVTRSANGMVILSVTERTPCWRVLLENSALLVDGEMTVLEIVEPDGGEALPTLGISLAELPDVGDVLPLTEEETAFLSGFSAAMQNLQETQGAELDFTDLYHIRLRLQDGSVILLHGTDSPLSTIPSAVAAMLRYRVETGDVRPLSVNVGENGNISLSVLTEGEKK